MAREGFDYSLTKYDVERMGYQVALDYQFNEIAYVELGYLDLGDVSANLSLDGDENQTAFGEAMARHYPLTERWYLSPEVGGMAR